MRTHLGLKDAPRCFLDGDDDVARNDTAHYLDSAPHRRPSHVALQLRLGLLSLERPRPRSHHHPHPRAAVKVLELSAATRDQGILSARGWTLLTTDRGRCAVQDLWQALIKRPRSLIKRPRSRRSGASDRSCTRSHANDRSSRTMETWSGTCGSLVSVAIEPDHPRARA